MISPILIQRRQRRYKARQAAPAGPTALVLEAASYDSNLLTLLLTFDRAINISGYVGSAVTVNDGVTNDHAYGGTGGASQPMANQILVNLVTGRTYSGTMTLHVTTASGIVAVNDGGSWTGANYIALPYP